MTDEHGGPVPADAPTEHDALLAALPLPVVASGLAGLASPVSLAVALGAGSLVSAILVVGALIVSSPV